MTPKMRGALESLKKMHHEADYEADKLVKRIEGEALPKLREGFKAAHGHVDQMGQSVDDILDFAEELKNSNGGELGNSESGYEEQSPLPRSSEVAGK